MKYTKNQYWIFVFVWVVCIYSTLSAVRPLCEILKKNTPFVLIANLFLGSLLAILFTRLIQGIKRKRMSGYFLLAAAALCYIYGLKTVTYPEEKIHFLEYGFLAYLIYRALRFDCPKILAALGSFFLTTILGWMDEGIQHLLPNRYYQNEDVVLNSVSGFLALLLIFIYERGRPKDENRL